MFDLLKMLTIVIIFESNDNSLITKKSNIYILFKFTKIRKYKKLNLIGIGLWATQLLEHRDLVFNYCLNKIHKQIRK